MKNLIFILFITLNLYTYSQAPKVYNPNADAKKNIEKAIVEADSLHKHVLLIIGGNWCPWCLKLNKFLLEDEVIDSIVHANYIVVKVNYSKEKSNIDILEKYEFPQRFGFPVLLVLNRKGERIHTQDSGFLEAADSYDRKKVISFLNNWSVKAINPDSYKKKEK